MRTRENRLRDAYVRGDIEVDEFERRLAAILRDRPEPDDSPVSLGGYTDEPGAVWYYSPLGKQVQLPIYKSSTGGYTAQFVGPHEEDDPETARPGTWEQS